MATQPTQAITKVETSPLIMELATDWKINPSTMLATLKSQIFKAQVSNEVMISFLMVCNTYKLNPFVKEIYAFEGKGGGFVPMVPIDGWANIVNRNNQFDGLEFIDEWEKDDKGNRTLFSTTCIIYRKDRSHPIRVTEYMQECYQPTKEPWKKWPARMLRHKAMIQCARIAFSLAGIYDPDEAERIAEAEGGGGKQEIKRPTVIDANQTESSSPATVQGTDAGAASASAAESSTVSDQPGQAAPARNSGQNGDAKPETAAVGDTPEMPGTASPKCFCPCCKNLNCDCIGKEEIDRCGCPNCVKYMQLMQQNEEREKAAEPEAGPKPKPAGPYAPQERLKKLFAAAAGAGIKVVKDSHDDDLHRILKEKWGIESVKEIPLAIFDEVVRTIAPNLKVK